MSEDNSLLSRIATGDKAAMRQFYERNHKPLFGFLRARGADGQTADDVIQDAMLDVWRSAARFDGRARGKTWLFAIARNKLIDHQRKSSRLSVVEDVPEQIDDAPDAETVLTSAADAGRVRACLAKLKAHHLAVIRLAFYEDLTYGEIAEIEAVPAGTIKTRVFHAKKLLMKCLGRR